MLTQIFLLVGNQITQAILAVITAVKQRNAGSAAVRFWGQPLIAFVRGLCGLELAYHAWGKDVGHQLGPEGSRVHIQASLNYKLAELVWEAPQVLVS